MSIEISYTSSLSYDIMSCETLNTFIIISKKFSLLITLDNVKHFIGFHNFVFLMKKFDRVEVHLRVFVCSK